MKIMSTVKTNASTGIEMEALTAVSVSISYVSFMHVWFKIAALTVYDMCKAISSEMVIHNIRLISKTGGKADYLYKSS